MSTIESTEPLIPASPNTGGTVNAKKPLSRWKAAGIHLAISALIASLVMGVLFLIWYPSALFKAMGGDQLVYLIVGCDVVLGPLITLVIFKQGKKGLTFDLAVIGFIQAAALVYGVTVAAEARPVYNVFVVDRFEVTAANSIDEADFKRVKDPRYKSLPWMGPVTVAAIKPTNADEQFEMITSGMNGKDMNTFPHLFVPYEAAKDEAGRRAHPLDELRRLNPTRVGEIDEFLRSRGFKDVQVGFLPLKAKRTALAVIVNRAGDILGMMDMTPW